MALRDQTMDLFIKVVAISHLYSTRSKTFADLHFLLSTTVAYNII